MPTKTRRYNLKKLPKPVELAGMSFGRQIEHLRAIREFCATAKSGWVSQKRKASAIAIREFCKLNDVKEFYCEFYDDSQYWDDTFEIFYTSNV